jgi:hypothetical protein
MLAAVCFTALSSCEASAQAEDRCFNFVTAVAPDKGGAAVVPEQYLADTNVAVPCLTQILDGIGGQIASPAIDADARNKLLSVSGALRSIMTRLDAADKASGSADADGLQDFISMFRDKSTANVISALTFGVRSYDRNLRLSATLLLGNVIDNRFVCIPLVHLNDPDFMKSAEAVKARANLLSIVSVVAPWAYKENYNNMQKTRDFVNGQINRDDPDLKTTIYVLDNIQARLKSQTGNSNKAVSLNPSFAEVCRKYVQAYLPKPASLENVAY